ncbi:putative defense protein [Cryptotermes secundus]|uniref:putative defense protein n=1 Tax=Cryptotermes secundus TaxID=105785 RepID=UPI000CD7D139|nr:putative defense protein [Cryptotermes secundus]
MCILEAVAASCMQSLITRKMESLSVSVLVAMLSLVAGSPIPDDPNRLISFAVTTEAPTTPLADVHQNLSSVCQSMLPSHNNSLPQNSDAPYKVSASPVKVARGGQVTVELAGLDDVQFRGLFVQARNGNDEPVGRFLSSDDKHVTLTNCGKGTNNAVSYISYDPISQFSFRWLAPEEATTVRFRATVVKSFSEFWFGVESGPVVVED